MDIGVEYTKIRIPDDGCLLSSALRNFPDFQSRRKHTLSSMSAGSGDPTRQIYSLLWNNPKIFRILDAGQARHDDARSDDDAFRQTGARVPAWECGLRTILTEFFAPGPDIGPRRKTFGKNRPPSLFRDGSSCACLAVIKKQKGSAVSAPQAEGRTENHLAREFSHCHQRPLTRR